LYEIDPTTNTVVRQITVGQVAIDVTVSGDGRFAYVTNNGSGNLSVVDLASSNVTTVSGLSQPHSVIIPGVLD
jgi:YVTN family beta-propeller protein